MPQIHATRICLVFFTAALCFTASPAMAAQGLDTQANRDEWEQINFEFNSSVLVDGFPSLLRLADLLSKNPAYRVSIEGNADWVGSGPYNDKLGLARANMVKAFLEKYGARAGQIETASRGKENPRVPNTTAEGRFMNRRVVVNVFDGQGRRIAAGSVGDAIRAMPQPAAAPQPPPDILKKLEEILAAIRDLKGENEQLKRELALLRGQQPPPAAPPPPPPTLPTIPTPPTAAEIAAEVNKGRLPRFSLLGMNAGADDQGRLTFTGKGRFFAPFSRHFAFQSEAEYLYFREQKEGQFDFGLVGRTSKFQAGLFGSLKHVTFNRFQNGVTLGQGAVTLDYVFSRGRVGVFGTKAFMDDGMVNRAQLNRNVWEETYVNIIDQVGASTLFGLWGDSYLEGNIAYLKSHTNADRPGGTLRFVQPLSQHWAFTLEGGFNETLLGRDHWGRFAAGVRLGNFVRPKEYATFEHPVPVDIPRVRYELLTRRVRTGNDIPVADAGPDQLGASAGTITLDGSASYDPDGDPITFEWSQVAGPTVTLSAPTAARTTFTAAESQMYSFRLTVKDSLGATAIARTSVMTRSPEQVRIVRFAAEPSTIRAGQTTTIVWEVLNAETVEISGLGRVDPRAGTSTLAPRETTTYRITARNRTSEASQAITVTVDQPQARILGFTASPTSIAPGESSTLSWQTENAERVTISEIGAVGQNGTRPVSPNATTTYTITVSNAYSEVRADVTVTVEGGQPRIGRFVAVPSEILPGETSTLIWETMNATEVSITPGPGTVGTSGAMQVSPTQTTTYTIRVRNRLGEVTATTTVTVGARTTIAKCMAMPMAVQRAGDPVALTFEATNATQVVLEGVGPVTSPHVVRPERSTTYTLTAIGARSQASCQIMVTVGMGGPD